VTNHQLYAVYVGAYFDSSHFVAEGETARRASARQRARLSPTERAIADLAVHDATNGTPMRSEAQFARCLAEGAPLLRRLGLREAQGSSPATAPGLAWAAT